MTKRKRERYPLGMNRILIVAALLLGLLPCAAQAGTYGPGRPFGEAELAALAQAEAYWGQQPTLCTSRTMEVVAPGALGVDEQGRDVGGRATQPEAPMPCGMWIEEDELGDGLCSLVRHEYGHWLSFGHEDPELAQMPPCLKGSAAADGGSYRPPNERVVARRQGWELFREWRAGCRREPIGSRTRHRCFAGVQRFGKRLRERWA